MDPGGFARRRRWVAAGGTAAAINVSSGVGCLHRAPKGDTQNGGSSFLEKSKARGGNGSERAREGGYSVDRAIEKGADSVELFGFEGLHGGQVVTAAPFSAVAVQETTQTLADGNHISRKSQVNLFRDSQGRFRKEVTLSGFGPLAASGQLKSFVVIIDPVANASFVLHPETKAAEKMGRPFRGMKDPMRGAFKEKVLAREQEEIASGHLKKEDLGTQTISGVSAQGTRLTRTIPAGQIGNEIGR